MTLSTIAGWLGLTAGRPVVRVPDVRYWRASEPDAFPIHALFEDWEGSTVEDHVTVCSRVWHEFLKPLGNVALVTRRPDRYPCDYGVLHVGVPLGFLAHQFPGRTVAAFNSARWTQPFVDFWQSSSVYLDVRQMSGVDGVVGNAKHELAHALGWRLTDDGRHWPPEGSAEWWAICRAGAATAAELVRNRPWRKTGGT